MLSAEGAPPPGRASTMAPMSATRRRREAISKGTAQRVKELSAELAESDGLGDDVVGPGGGDRRRDERPHHAESGDGGDGLVLGVEVARFARLPGEHQGEEHDDDDRAAVDEHLHQGEERREDQDVDAGDGEEAEEKEEGGVDHVGGDDDADAAGDGERGDRDEHGQLDAHAGSASFVAAAGGAFGGGLGFGVPGLTSMPARRWKSRPMRKRSGLEAMRPSRVMSASSW